MGFKAPKDISSLSAEDLQASINEAREAWAESDFDNIPDADLNDDQVTEMMSISDFIREATSEASSREQAANERAERLSAARQSMSVEDEDEAEEEEIPDGEAARREEEEEEEEEELPVEEEEEEEEEKPKRKMASRASRAASKSKRKAPVTKAAPRTTLTAAANVPGYSHGQKFDSFKGEAGQLLMNRLKGLPTAGDNKRVRDGALVLTQPENKFSQKNYPGQDTQMLLEAAQESSLSGGSLVAAGGWGAPSETVLDFCKIETTEGLLNLPEVSINRGGVQYTKGPSLADVMASSTGFWDMTEAVAEAGTEQKTSLRPTPPGFVEKRLDAVGLMVEAGFLLNTGWPEVVDRYTELAVIAHQHKMSAKSIAQIEAYTGAAIDVPNGYGNALDVLHVLEVVATGERSRYKMSMNATLEVLLPHWVKAVIRADLANRNGVDYINISDAQINAFFSARKLRVQWLHGYQEIDTDTNGIATAYPASVEAIMYPAGTYVRGTSDVISLDTVYDSTNLKRNDFVNLFLEQGTVVTNPCNDGRRISLPLVATGTTGAANIDRGLFVAPAV